MANIITLTGASHCGKSFVRKLFLELKNENFNPVLYKKETTREPRINDDDVIHVKKISSKCDFVYEQYGVRYGFSYDDLFNHLIRGESPIIVVNDVRAVEDLRTAIGNQVISIFIYRRPPQLDLFINEELERLKNKNDIVERKKAENTARVRMEKATAIHRIYIENIHLFDNVILNISNEKEKTKQQVQHIINKMTKAVEGLV